MKSVISVKWTRIKEWWPSLSLANKLGVLGFVVAALVALSEIRSCNLAKEANDIARNVQMQEEERRTVEQEKNAYLSFRLGRDLTEATASFLGVTHTWSSERLIYLQGLVDRLGLIFDLKTHFASLTNPGSILAVHHSIPLELMYERIRDFHNEEIAAAFNLGRYTVWLSHLGICAKSDEEKQNLQAIYERDVPIFNQELEKLGRITKRNIASEYKLQVETVDVDKATATFASLLTAMPAILHQKKGAHISSWLTDCTFYQPR